MSISLPQGFRFSGFHSGVKSDPEMEDLALIASDRPAVAAGVYTQNVVVSPAVVINRAKTPRDDALAVVVNAGNANACTGQRGLEDARRMAALTGELCSGNEQQALVMSTGIIGEFLPMDKITRGIQHAAKLLAPTEEGFMAAARGMLTTDQGTKTASRRLTLGQHTVNLAGMCKGAGMIGPNMATMLGLVITDAKLTPSDAQSSLAAAIDESFNCISVEGHTSTSDTVLLLANGAACDEPLSGDPLQAFTTALTEVAIELATQIPADGEGASHLIEIQVEGCLTREDARQIARTVASSALVKTAITGADPNWGRIVSAAGYAGVAFDPDQIELELNGTPLFRAGSPVDFDPTHVSQSIRDQHKTRIVLRFQEGPAAARFWASDLTVDYVKFNSEYHT